MRDKSVIHKLTIKYDIREVKKLEFTFFTLESKLELGIVKISHIFYVCKEPIKIDNFTTILLPNGIKKLTYKTLTHFSWQPLKVILTLKVIKIDTQVN
jgi:hypothetical protein